MSQIYSQVRKERLRRLAKKAGILPQYGESSPGPQTGMVFEDKTGSQSLQGGGPPDAGSPSRNETLVKEHDRLFGSFIDMRCTFELQSLYTDLTELKNAFPDAERMMPDYPKDEQQGYTVLSLKGSVEGTVEGYWSCQCMESCSPWEHPEDGKNFYKQAEGALANPEKVAWDNSDNSLFMWFDSLKVGCCGPCSTTDQGIPIGSNRVHISDFWWNEFVFVNKSYTTLDELEADNDLLMRELWRIKVENSDIGMEAKRLGGWLDIRDCAYCCKGVK